MMSAGGLLVENHTDETTDFVFLQLKNICRL